MERLVPPETKPKRSVARVLDDWYVVARAADLGDKPIAVTLMGIPMAIFRDAAGQVGALLDRCPHRNVPLSIGRVEGPHLECGYHGWRFDREGECQHVPALCAESAAKGRKGRQVTAYPAREQQGYVWVYPTPMEQGPPAREPFRFPLADDPRYATVHHDLRAPGSVHAVAENALDVPHTAFLHRGLFRNDGDRNEIEVQVRRWHDRVEAEYIGEPRPEGILGRVLAPGGGVVQHFDRFVLPSIAQVEYRLGEQAHVWVCTALTPIGDYETHMWNVVSFKLGFLPPKLGALAGEVLKPLGLQVLRQDIAMLRKQTATIERFGGERYVSTEIDVLGPHILRLLQQAERGREAPGEPERRSFTMHV